MSNNKQRIAISNERIYTVAGKRVIPGIEKQEKKK